MNNKVLRCLPMEYSNIINPIEIYKDINIMPFQELIGILKNAEIKLKLQKKRLQEDAKEVKKNALMGAQVDFSSEESSKDDDELAFIIKKANKMMRNNLYKKKDF